MADERLREVAERAPGLAGDIDLLIDLRDRDAASALNKARFIAEKVLLELCRENGVERGRGQPTIGKMIGPLVEADALPKNVAVHVRTIQTNTSPGSHFQEDALDEEHVSIALRALAALLEWRYEGARPQASKARRAAAASRIPWTAVFLGLATVGIALASIAMMRDTPTPPAPPRPDADAAIRGRVREIVPTIQRCYERAADEDERLAGRVMVRFRIEPNGEVSGIRLDDGVHDEPLSACVRGSIAELRFDEAPGTDPVDVAYPIDFAAGDLAE